MFLRLRINGFFYNFYVGISESGPIIQVNLPTYSLCVQRRYQCVPLSFLLNSAVRVDIASQVGRYLQSVRVGTYLLFRLYELLICCGII